MGSCVDNSRILVLASELANILNVGIHKLPIVVPHRNGIHKRQSQ